MPLFVIFVFGTVILGAGAMLAPAWPTEQPRIGLSGTLALGLVVGGAVFWAMLFGWTTLVIDYLLFALITVIFLGGTLSQAQARAEAKGEKLADADQGWPGPKDLAFFALMAFLFAIPALVLPVPLDTDAQGFGYLALVARQGGSFDSLAPFHPEISYLYAPGLTALTAYLSQQLQQPIHITQMSLSAVLMLLNVWLAYDFGAEWQDKRLGRALALALLLGTGLFTAYMDAHYTTIMALSFLLAFLIYALRYLRHQRLMDAVAAGLMLGMIVLTHPDTTIIAALGYIPWLLTMWWGDPRPAWRTWLVLALGVPLVALVGIAPWLLSIRDLLGANIVSPFERFAHHWQVMIVYHGGGIVLLAVVGTVTGLRRRASPGRRPDQLVLLSLGWLLLLLDFSTTGVLERVVPWLVAPILRYDYPFSLAWHGPIIPYTILGGFGLLWLWDNHIKRRWGDLLARRAYALIAVGATFGLATLVLSPQLLALSKGLGRDFFFGAFSSHADVAAMAWLRENTPPDARLLNFPDPHEGDWVPVIAERDAVYYRPQPFFQGDDDSLGEQARLRAFWEDPADPAHAVLLAESGVDYVIVPQVVGDPDSFATMFRWREPFAWGLPMQSQIADAPYLELVFESAGAQVYRVR